MPRNLALFRFKTEHKGKAACIFQRTVFYTVKPQPIIKPKQAKHRQEKTHSEADTAAQAERIIISIIIPSIRRLEKCKSVNCTVRIGGKWISQLKDILIKNGKEL